MPTLSHVKFIISLLILKMIFNPFSFWGQNYSKFKMNLVKKKCTITGFSQVVKTASDFSVNPETRGMDLFKKFWKIKTLF